MNRFLKHTKRVGNCLVWTGCKTAGGYGRFAMNGSSVLAHRFAAFLAGKLSTIEWSGDWRSDDFVRHACGNHSCVNPDHLIIGTHKENMDDKRAHGRVPNFSGINNPNCRTSINDVVHIRALHKNGASPSQISTKLGLPLSRVEQIAYFKTFKGDQYALER